MLIDQTNPFGNGHLLPRGILREPISHMSRASYIFITKSNGNPPEALLDDIKLHAPLTEIITCTHAPQYLIPVFEKIPHLPIEWLKGQNIAVFSGIAAPESFEGQLQSQGANLIYTERFLDHHRFDQKELHSLYHQAAASGASAIITTQKDAVRLPETPRPTIPMYYLKLEINILNGGDDFQDAISRICFPRALKPRPS
jgi:tetraacyldisaccharide 4'-kinase